MTTNTTTTTTMNSKPSLLKSILKRNYYSNLNVTKTCNIFLSYHWQDQVEVIKLHRELCKYFTVWLDLVEIRVGDDLNERVEEAIKECNIFLCCINNEYLKTPNCRYELLKAHNEGKQIYVLPFERLYIDEELLSEYKIKIEKVYEAVRQDDNLKVDKDISSILTFLFGNNNSYPAFNQTFKRIYNFIPSVHAYRA